MKRLSLRLFVLFCLVSSANAYAQQSVTTSPAESITAAMRITKQAAPSIVLIKAGSAGQVTAQGTGVIIRADGILLTAYHVIKDAKQIQVTLKDGETYDRVEVLGVDERRDVAALRIALKNLPALVTRTVTDEHIGERVFTLSNPQGMNWTISEGLLSGVRLADDVPGAGKGYKLLQFTAPSSPGSSGGALVDGEGRAIGLIVGALNGGQNLNFAVPLAAVVALADQTTHGIIAGGLALTEKPKEPEKIEERTGKAVAVVESSRTERVREARLVYVEHNTRLCKPIMLQNALFKYATQLDEWQVKLVDNRSVADVIVELDHMPMTFYFTYNIRDIRASVILGAGRVTAWDCNLAAPGLAKQIVNVLAGVRQPPKLITPEKTEKAAKAKAP